MKSHSQFPHVLIFVASLLCLPLLCQSDDSYENVDALMNAKLGAGTYNVDLRPLNNQSNPFKVHISFSLMSVVQIDDVQQRFTLNGFLSMVWTDERVSWNPWDYGGVDYLQPQPKNIWRPRVLLLNTLGDRDLFKDSFSPLFVDYNGTVAWMPGGLFRGACALNMQKYPFDEQWCYIRMCPMSYYTNKLQFEAKSEDFDLTFFSPNEGWDLTKTKVSIVQVTTEDNQKYFSCPNFSFKLKRRPMFFIFNIVLPVLVLSFLNTMVFIIPTESGEKIGYGITVLLALSVFLTTVSSMVPRVSDNIPVIAIYLFVLLMCSGLSVLASMVIVHLYFIQVEEETPSKAKTQNPFKKMFGFKRAIISPHDTDLDSSTDQTLSSPSSSNMNSTDITMETNKYKALSNQINKLCFAASIVILVVVNTVFMVYLRS